MIGDEKFKIERMIPDIIVLSAIMIAVERQRVYSDYFDASAWPEDDTWHEAAREIAETVGGALLEGRIEEEAIARHVETVLQEIHSGGLLPMEEALAWQVRRVLAALRDGEPRPEPGQVIVY